MAMLNSLKNISKQQQYRQSTFWYFEVVSVHGNAEYS